MASKMEKIKKEEGKKFVCQLCPYETDEQRRFKGHVDAIHAKIKDHFCSVCARSFSQEGSLKRHITLIHLRENLRKRKSYFCPIFKIGFDQCHLNSSLFSGIKQFLSSFSFQCKLIFKNFVYKDSTVIGFHSDRFSQ